MGKKTSKNTEARVDMLFQRDRVSIQNEVREGVGHTQLGRSF